MLSHFQHSVINNGVTTMNERMPITLSSHTHIYIYILTIVALSSVPARYYLMSQLLYRAGQKQKQNVQWQEKIHSLNLMTITSEIQSVE